MIEPYLKGTQILGGINLMKKLLVFTMLLTTMAFADHGGPHIPERPHEIGHGNHDGGHDHGRLVLTHTQIRPQVSIRLTRDSMKGFNLKVTTLNFEFAPNNVGKKVEAEDLHGTEMIEGHAHLYINGEKVTRIYGPDFYVGRKLTVNDSIEVRLSSNDHRELVINGKSVSDRIAPAE